MSINNKPPYDPISSLPNHIKKRVQTAQGSHAMGINTVDVLNVEKHGDYSLHHMENNTTVVTANAWIPGNNIDGNGAPIRYRSLLDEPSNSDYSTDMIFDS